MSMAARETAKRTTLAYYIAFVALGLATAAVGPTLIGLAHLAAVPLAAISIVFTTQSAGYILGSLIGGQIYDRVPGHPVLIGSLILTGLAFGAIPLIPSLYGLAAVFFAIGLFQGALDVGGNTLIGWLHGRHVGPYMNALHFFFGLGAFAAPLVVALALTNTVNGLTWAYWSLAGLILLSALLPIGLPSPQNAYSRPTPNQPNQPFLLIGLIVIFYLLYVAAEHTFGGWVFSYATWQGDAVGSVTTAALLNSAFWGSFTLGRLISIPLAARMRPRTILLLDLTGAVASLAVILLWPASTLALWVGVIGFGLALASIFPTMLIWAGRRIRLTGAVTGLFFVGGSTGGMIFPWLTGQFFDRFGPSAAIWTVQGVVVAVLVIFFLVMARGGPPVESPESSANTASD